MMLGTMVFVVPSVEAKSAATVITAAPQYQVRQNRRNRRTRTVTQKRVTRVGRYRYRETYRTTYFANGRTRTQVTRRVRLANTGRIRY